jgi:hypothetical protein
MLLSRDAKRSRDDIRLGSPKILGRVKRGRRVHVAHAGGTVPSKTKVGSYRVLACFTAGRAKPVCAAARRRVGVQAAFPIDPDQPPPAPPAPPAPVVVAAFPRPAAPLAITPHRDDARAVTKSIGVDGGTIAATAGNGATLTLTIPQGALLDDTAITLTPLSAADGLPFSGGLLAGAQLEPSGLQLAVPARLKITGGPAGIAFGYRADGADLHLLPATGDGIEIDHFSGAGLAGGTAGERDAMGAHAPADAQAQSEQARVLENEAAVLDAYYHGVVEPDLNGALADTTLAPDAALRAEAFDLQLQARIDDPRVAIDHTALRDVLQRVITGAADHAYHACVDHGSIDDARRLLALQLVAERAQVGIPSADARVRGCLRFELDADVEISDTSPPDPQSTTHHVVTNLLVQGEPAGLTVTFHGSKDPDSATFTYSYTSNGCTISNGTVDITAPFTVDHVAMAVVPQTGFPLDLAVTVGTSESLEHFSASGSGQCQAPDPIPIHVAHFAGFYGGTEATIGGWTITQASPLIATKPVDRSTPRPNGGSATEHSTYTLRHVPIPGA